MNENPLLQIRMWDAPISILEGPAEKRFQFNELVAQVVGKLAGVDPDQIDVRSMRPLCNCNKQCACGPVSVQIVWMGQHECSRPDEEIRKDVFYLIGRQFGEEHNPMSQRALENKYMEAFYSLVQFFALVTTGRMTRPR
jgi:hypothetical protein